MVSAECINIAGIKVSGPPAFVCFRWLIVHTERQTDRQTDRQTETETDRDTDTERERDRDACEVYSCSFTRF